MQQGIWQSRWWEEIGYWAFRVTRWALRLPFWPFTVPRVRTVIIAEGHVLVVRQWFSEKKWELPGGGMRAGETSFQAARREVDEEVGLKLGELEDGGLYQPIHRTHVWQIVSTSLDHRPLLLITRPYEILAARWLPLTELGDSDVDKTTRDIVASIGVKEIE